MFRHKCNSVTWHLQANIIQKEVEGIQCPQIQNIEDFDPGFARFLNSNYIRGFQCSINSFLRKEYGEEVPKLDQQR